MSLTIYGIKNCDTMKKAFRWLEEQELDYQFHDYKKSPVPEAQLKQWINEFGWDTILNKRGTTWRKLPDNIKNSMNSQQAVRVALENPSIIKRPVLVSNQQTLVGFKADDWLEKLK